MKGKRLNSLIFPTHVWYFFISPGFNLLMAVGNFLIDSLIVIVISSILFKKIDKSFYGKTIWKVWSLGLASSAIGLLYLHESEYIGYFLIDILNPSQDSLLYKILYGMSEFYHCIEPDIFHMINIGMGVVIAAIAIFLFNYLISFKNTDLTKKQKAIMSLSLAIFTAPYTFFITTPLFS